ncbi:hypothetical protein SUGI_0205040 [Cryptomeria japonica]|nr:hypothetical protein SUGI_0205040 [Cryptomeria japonica]
MPGLLNNPHTGYPLCNLLHVNSNLIITQEHSCSDAKDVEDCLGKLLNSRGRKIFLFTRCQITPWLGSCAMNSLSYSNSLKLHHE